MLQDLSYGKLENEFCHIQPEAEDFVLCFCNRQLLLKTGQGSDCIFPTCGEVMHWAESESWQPWFAESIRYVFRMQEKNYFLYLGDIPEQDYDGYHFEPVRPLQDRIRKDACYAAMTAWHLYVWYRNNRFCGCCGNKTQHDTIERMLRCPECGNMIFPRISPAVIIAITDGDRLLMSKYAGRYYTHYALIAGYTEIGETVEQTVQREVMEEVGLKVKNLRYYKSQPWGVDGSVLMGFYCDLDGDDTIHVDGKELALAEWHHRDAIPQRDNRISLTCEMIRIFEEGREPK